jgi:hypothetical protein
MNAVERAPLNSGSFLDIQPLEGYWRFLGLGRIRTQGIHLGEHAVQGGNLGDGRSAARSRRSTAALGSNRSNRFVFV